MRFRMSRIVCGASVRWLFCSPCSTADSTACSIAGSRNQAGSSPARFRYGFTTARRMAWRTYSVSRTGLRVARAGLAQRLQDGNRVADRDPLAQQVLQHALHRGQRQQLGHQILDHLGVLHRHPVQQPLGVLARKQLMGVAADQFGKMRAQHAHAVHHGVAGVARPFRALARNPEGGRCRRPARASAARRARGRPVPPGWPVRSPAAARSGRLPRPSAK